MTFKGQGVNFLITEIDKSGPLTFEGQRDHPGSPSSKRLTKSDTLNRLVNRSSRSVQEILSYRKAGDSRDNRHTNPMEISAYFEVRGGTGLSYRRSTKFCMRDF